MKLPSGGVRTFDFGSSTYSSDHLGAPITNFDDNIENWTYSGANNITLQSTFTNSATYSLGKVLQNKILVLESGEILNNADNIGFLFLEKLNLNHELVQSYGINTTDKEFNLEGGYFYSIKFTWTNSNDQGTALVNYSFKTKNPVQKQWLNGGGIRINTISYYDSPNDAAPQKKVIFSYNKFADSGKSSGALVFPKPLLTYKYGYGNKFVSTCGGMSVGYCQYPYANEFAIYSSQSFLPVQKTQGSDVGYQNITVSETDKGRTEYSYTSPIDKPNPDSHYINFELPPFLPVDNYDYKRGLLTKDEKKDNTNITLYKKDTEYNIYDSRILTGLNISYINSPYSEYLYAGHFNSYENYYAGCIQDQGLNVFCDDRTNVSSMMRILPVEEIIGRANPTHSETIESFNGKNLKTIEDITYNTRDYPIKEKNTTPDGTVTETSYQYAHEKGNQLMIDKNVIGIPLETTTTQTTGIVTKTVDRSETIYPTALPTIQTGGLVEPLSERSYDRLNNTSTTDLTYDKYDEKGNLQQYTTKDGIPTVIIWGYNKTEPIAQVEGMTYAQVAALSTTSSIISASDNDALDPAKENLLLIALNNFRKEPALAGKKISTYTYDPLIGVTSITPPSGIREVFTYDSAGRLKDGNIRMKNTSGTDILKMVKKNRYGYKQ
jgi:YD repeat-containing protein